jgi:hypothetical protein
MKGMKNIKKMPTSNKLESKRIIAPILILAGIGALIFTLFALSFETSFLSFAKIPDEETGLTENECKDAKQDTDYLYKWKNGKCVAKSRKTGTTSRKDREGVRNQKDPFRLAGPGYSYGLTSNGTALLGCAGGYQSGAGAGDTARMYSYEKTFNSHGETEIIEHACRFGCNFISGRCNNKDEGLGLYTGGNFTWDSEKQTQTNVPVSEMGALSGVLTTAEKNVATTANKSCSGYDNEDDSSPQIRSCVYTLNGQVTPPTTVVKPLKKDVYARPKSR